MSRRYGMTRLGGTVLALTLVGFSWLVLWLGALTLELALTAWGMLAGA